jgi:Tfp pilus assembly protein PilF/uncharacterized protein YfiM (DUF2279 family)
MSALSQVRAHLLASGRHRYRMLAAVGVLAGLLFAANLFGAQLNRLFMALPGVDKVLHVSFFAILFVAARAAAAARVAVPRTQALLALVAGLVLATADELFQGLTSSRSVEAADFAADCCGLLLGWALTAPVRRAVSVGVAAAALCAAAFVTYDTHMRLRDFSRAVAYERTGDFVRAREHYLRALAGGMRSPALFNELGWVEIESGIGDPQKAVEYAKTALDMQPDNPDILDTYGWALHHAGRTGEAIRMLEQAYAADPEMYCIHYHLGAAYMAAGRREQAEMHLRRQVELRGTREAVFARQALERMEKQQ